MMNKTIGTLLLTALAALTLAACGNQKEGATQGADFSSSAASFATSSTSSPSASSSPAPSHAASSAPSHAASSAASPNAPSPATSPSASSSPYASEFRTSVFLGDSITEGLSYHDVLDEENVLAGAGKTAEFALKDVDELAKRKPEHVFIQLGSDDILWPTDDPLQYSLQHYAQLIDAVKEKLPDADITLLSVTPVTAEAEKAEPRYQNIADYNDGVKALAAEEKVGFVDLTPVVKEHEDLYDADGIHFQKTFYPFLLDYLTDQVPDLGL